jgi:hypothetical protein
VCLTGPRLLGREECLAKNSLGVDSPHSLTGTKRTVLAISPPTACSPCTASTPFLPLSVFQSPQRPQRGSYFTLQWPANFPVRASSLVANCAAPAGFASTDFSFNMLSRRADCHMRISNWETWFHFIAASPPHSKAARPRVLVPCCLVCSGSLGGLRGNGDQHERSARSLHL